MTIAISIKSLERFYNMSTKKVYFLRHGQTKLNKGWVHQSPSTPLSELGEKQAAAIAEQIKDYDIDLIITS